MSDKKSKTQKEPAGIVEELLQLPGRLFKFALWLTKQVVFLAVVFAVAALVSVEVAREYANVQVTKISKFKPEATTFAASLLPGVCFLLSTDLDDERKADLVHLISALAALPDPPDSDLWAVRKVWVRGSDERDGGVGDWDGEEEEQEDMKPDPKRAKKGLELVTKTFERLQQYVAAAEPYDGPSTRLVNALNEFFGKLASPQTVGELASVEHEIDADELGDSIQGYMNTLKGIEKSADIGFLTKYLIITRSLIIYSDSPATFKAGELFDGLFEGNKTFEYYASRSPAYAAARAQGLLGPGWPTLMLMQVEHNIDDLENWRSKESLRAALAPDGGAEEQEEE